MVEYKIILVKLECFFVYWILKRFIIEFVESLQNIFGGEYIFFIFVKISNIVKQKVEIPALAKTQFYSILDFQNVEY